MKSMSISARVYIISTAILGFAIIGHAILQWESQDLARFFSYFFIAILASTLKVILPGITGSMSVNFLFILIGILDLSFPETIVIGCTATMVQCVWKALTRPKPGVANFPANPACYLFHLPLLLLVPGETGRGKNACPGNG